jgi:hypothetical protein
MERIDMDIARSERSNSVMGYVRIALIVCGLSILLFGIYATGPRITQWAALYWSRDGVVSEHGVMILNRLRIGIMLAGLLIGLSSMAVTVLDSWMTRLGRMVFKNIDWPVLLERAFNYLGNLTHKIFELAVNQKTLLSVLIIIMLTVPVTGYLLSPTGFHAAVDYQPAINLARNGIYGTATVRGVDDLTERTTIGPALNLPRAMVFYLFGVNLYYSRIVGIMFFFGSVLAFFLLSDRLYGRKTAWLATFMVSPLMMNATDSTIGEGYLVALFYIMIGALFWFKSVDRASTANLVIAGIFWGLAFQTKWLALFVAPALVATWILLAAAGRPISHRYYILPGIPIILITGAWTAFRIWNIGLRQELIHMKSLIAEHGHRAVGMGSRRLSFIGDMVSVLTHPLTSLSSVDLWGYLQLFLVVPAVIYGIVLLFRDRLSDYRSLFVMNFTLIWFIWWLFFNPDLYTVHLAIALYLFQIFVSRLIIDLWKFTEPMKIRFFDLFRGVAAGREAWTYLARVSVVCIIILSVVPPLVELMERTLHRNERVTKTSLEMVSYVWSQTEGDAVFSGWQWSIPFYLNFDPARSHPLKDRSKYPLDQREKVPEYFIESPEWPVVKTTDDYPNVAHWANSDKWYRENNARRKQFITENCELVKSFGEAPVLWNLYRVKNGGIR